MKQLRIAPLNSPDLLVTRAEIEEAISLYNALFATLMNLNAAMTDKLAENGELSPADTEIVVRWAESTQEATAYARARLDLFVAKLRGVNVIV